MTSRSAINCALHDDVALKGLVNCNPARSEAECGVQTKNKHDLEEVK